MAIGAYGCLLEILVGGFYYPAPPHSPTYVHSNICTLPYRSSPFLLNFDKFKFQKRRRAAVPDVKCLIKMVRNSG